MKYKEGLYGCLGTYVYIGVGDVLQIRIDGLYRKYNVGICIWVRGYMVKQVLTGSRDACKA